MTKIRPPETLADVPRWLTEWAGTLEENGQVIATVLRQLGAELGDVEQHPRSAAEIADLNAADTAHNPYARQAPGTLVENAAFRCPAYRHFPGRDVLIGDPLADQHAWRHEDGQFVKCNLVLGHPAGEMHTGYKDDGTACYWVDEPTESAVIPVVDPAAWLDIAAVPAVEPVAEPWPSGPACAAPGPSGLLCIAVAAHDGPCWSPTQGAARIAWRTDAAGQPYPVSAALIGGDQ